MHTATQNADPCKSLAHKLLVCGWEGLSQAEAQSVNESVAAVAEHLPHPVGLALFDIVDQQPPWDYKGLPARIGKKALLESMAKAVALHGSKALK